MWWRWCVALFVGCGVVVCSLIKTLDSGLFTESAHPIINLSGLMSVWPETESAFRARPERPTGPRPQSKLTVVRAVRPQTTASTQTPLRLHL